MITAILILIVNPFALQWQPTLFTYPSFTVTVTHYSSSRAETDDSPAIGACGHVGPGTVALSRDLFKMYDCGTRVRVGGAPYVVRDTMHGRWRLRADVWMPSRRAALRAGRRTDVMEVTR